MIVSCKNKNYKIFFLLFKIKSVTDCHAFMSSCFLAHTFLLPMAATLPNKRLKPNSLHERITETE